MTITPHELGQTGIHTWACAWDHTLVRENPQVVRDHPSLVVFDEGDGATPEDAEAICEFLGSVPVMVVLEEPSFARYLPPAIEAWREAVGKACLDLIVLRAEEVSDLKGGGMLQPLQEARNTGGCLQFGFACEDANEAEWLAKNTVGRVIALPYHVQDQSAWYRAIPTIHEYGMAAIAVAAPELEADPLASRFALGRWRDCLPIRHTAVPHDLIPMPEDELERVWDAYRQNHEEPPALPRSRPPSGGLD